uniref:NF-kappa-B inhibitor-like protein 1 n=1 Tax=Oryzias sinensis TaxID=183150 RepID=A0A8C7YFP9_9TELE
WKNPHPELILVSLSFCRLDRSMVSRRQVRVWKYVEEGSCLKLKSYLRKHRDLDLNFSQGKRQRSPLHLACSLGDDAVLRLLLQHGADVLQTDRRGDTPLHTAANRALKLAYDDLVVPLKKACPEALNASNRTGVTPLDLLTDDFLPVDEDEEDFGDWAERIRREYFSKKHAEAQKLAARWKTQKSGQRREQKEESHKDLHERLKREHEEYLARAAQKEEQTRQGKKRCYEERCAATFSDPSSSSSTKLSYSDIPWPAPKGTVQEMVDVMLHGVDRKNVGVFRKALLKQQTLWHPDKFVQRCEARLEEKDRKRILDTVTALSQELNRLAQSLKS